MGRIIFEGEDVEPYVLFDVDGTVMFEIVAGQYRIDRLADEACTQIGYDRTENGGDKKCNVP